MGADTLGGLDEIGEDLKAYFSHIHQTMDITQKLVEAAHLRGLLLYEYTCTTVALSKELIENYREKTQGEQA